MIAKKNDINSKSLMNGKFYKIIGYRIFPIIGFFLSLSVNIYGQNDPYQSLYDAWDAAVAFGKRSTNNTSRSSGSSDNNSNYISPTEQKRREVERKVEEAIQSDIENQKDAEERLQRDEPKMQKEIDQMIQQLQQKNKKEFQQMRAGINTSFKKQEQIYMDALTFDPQKKIDSPYKLDGEQIKELMDLLFDASGSTISAAIKQVAPYHPVFAFTLSNITSASIDIAKTRNQGRPLDVTLFRNNMLSTGTKGATPIVAKLIPFGSEKVKEAMVGITYGAVVDSEQGKSAGYILTNTAITGVGAIVPNEAHKAGSTIVAKRIFLKDKNKK